MQTTVTTAASTLPFAQNGNARLIVQNMGPGDLFIETLVAKPPVTITAATGVRIPAGGQLIFTDQVNQSGAVQVISSSTSDVRYTSL